VKEYSNAETLNADKGNDEKYLDQKTVKNEHCPLQFNSGNERDTPFLLAAVFHEAF
jgi:hypothetical protein